MTSTKDLIYDLSVEIGELRAENKHLKQMLASQKKQGWIPMSERWPEDDGLYLVSHKGVPKVALFAWGSWTMGTEDGTGQALPDAWMPFPEPYGPEQ